MYLRSIVYPTNLVPFYPLPLQIPIWQVVVAGAVIVGISLFVVALRQSQPALLMGWLWYLSTLLPVIGLISFGAHARADRYMYVPSIGVLIAIVWFSLLASRSRAATLCVQSIAVAAIAACAILTPRQVSHWHDSITLFRYTLTASPANALAYNNLGVALADRGEADAAIDNFRRAVSIPGYFNLADPYINLGAAMLTRDNAAEAADYLLRAVEYSPGSAKAHANLGLAFDDLGRTQAAIEQFTLAARLDPEDAEAQAGLAVALARTGAETEALSHAREALRLRPDSAAAQFDLGEVYGLLGRLRDAEDAFREATRLDPANPRTHFNLGITLGKQGRFTEAAQSLQAAIQLKPDYVTAWFNLGIALAQNGNPSEAGEAFRETLRLDPHFDAARDALVAIQSPR
jgi:tetratricopeptide (TPR) repeat protein